MDNGSEQLLAEIGDMRVVVCGETILQGIKHGHDIKNATVIRVMLRGGIPAAVGP